jgi:NitT/TauT family transport system substrate-binding protein
LKAAEINQAASPGRDEMTFRIVTVIVAACAAALSAFPVVGQTAAPEKTDISIAVGGKTFMIYLPLSVTERLGYFKEAGLNVRIEEVNSGTKSAQALVGGSVDATAGSFDHTIQLQAKGQIITSVVLMGRYPGIVFGLVGSQTAQYQGPQDLKGMKIGVTAPGSQTNLMVNYIMSKAGLKPNDASFIGVGGPASAVAAAKQGAIDALSHADPAITQLELSGELKPIYDTRSKAGTEAVFGGEYPSSVLYVLPSFIASYPNTTQALVAAIVRGLQWMEHASPEDIAKLMPKEYYMGNRDLYVAIIDRSKAMFSPDGRVSKAGAENALKVLSAFDPAVAGAKIDLDLTYTDRFVAKAMAAH